MNKLVVANLIHRPMRTIISVLAVAVEVVMILSIAGVFVGMLDDTRERTNGIGADLMVRPPNSSALAVGGTSALPIKFVDVVRKLPHVSAASPVIQYLSTAGKVEVLYGVDYASFNQLKPFTFVAGGPMQGPYDALVDDVFASSNKGYRVGDQLTIFKHSFRISGIVEHGKGARKMIPIDTMAELLDTEGKASVFYVKCDSAANKALVTQEILAVNGFENYQVETLDDWLAEMTPDHVPGFNIALDVVTFIAVVVGFLAIFQSMYTAVLERTREIGILKSMGASRSSIMGVVLREATLIAISGVALGLLGVFAIHVGLAHGYPTLHFEVTRDWIIEGSLIALAGSVLGALYPAWLAARKDPIDALAYE